MPFSANIQARGVKLLLSGVMTRVHKDLRFTDIPKRTETLRVETGAGPVDCTVYRPPVGTATPAPVYINFHGGGFIVARPEQDDHICRYIAAKAGCVVINVDYAVAPQRTFPTAVTQAYDVTAWVVEHGEAHDWDGSRVAVGGHSAGANLTAGVCRTARDRGTFTPRLQIIDSAPLDQVADPGTKQSRIAKPLLSPSSCGSSPPPTSRTRPTSPIPWPRRDLPTTSPDCRPPSSSPPRTTACATRATPTPRPWRPRACRSPTASSRASTTTSPTPARSPAGKEAIGLMADALRTALDTAVSTPPDSDVAGR